jgi:hypothetical protein
VDTRMERRLSRRPVAVVSAVLVVISMGTLTYKGATAKEAIPSEVIAAVRAGHRSRGLRARGSHRRRKLSPCRAARTATPTSAPAPRNLGARTSPRRARRTRGSVPDLASEVSELRQRGLPVPALLARRPAPAPAGGLPRASKGGK